MGVSGIALFDPPLPTADNVTMTLVAAHGTVTLSTAVTGGLLGNQIIGNGTRGVTIAGSVAQINATLAAAGGLTYAPTPGYNGTDTIHLLGIDPLGNSNTNSVSLLVAGPLTIATPPSQQVFKAGSTLSVSGVSLSDPSLPPNDNVTMILAATSGTITLSTNLNGGVAYYQVTNNGTQSVTVTAPVATIDASLAVAGGLTYTPNTPGAGTATLSLTASDPLGNSGASSVLLVEVGPLSVTSPATVPDVLVGGALAVGGIALADPMLPTTDDVTATMSAAEGTLTLSTTISGGLLANQIIGNGTSYVTIDAPLAAMNVTLAATLGLTYAPNRGYAGPDTLIVSAGDPLGDFGTGMVSLLVAGPLAITVPSAQTVPVGSAFRIGGVSLADPGLPTSAFVTVVMGAVHGSLNLSTSVSGGIAKAEVIGDGTGSVIVTAPLAAIDATLAATGGLNYTPNGGYQGADMLTVAALDTLGSSATASVPLTITGAIVQPLEVTGVLVGGTSWSSGFLSAVESAGQGNGRGYAIPVGSSTQLTALPWSNLNQIQIQFNQNVDIQENSLTVTGINLAQYTFTNFGYNSATHVATWTLSSSINIDKLSLDLHSTGPNAVTDTSGDALDGEWTNGTSSYPSGNGTAGGDFNFAFNVLPGDVNQGTVVNGLDISLIASHWLQTGGLAGDANGDDIVNGLDIAAIASHWLQTLPAGGVGGGSEAATIVGGEAAGGSAASIATASSALGSTSVSSTAISASIGTSASSTLRSSASLLVSPAPGFLSTQAPDRIAAFIGRPDVTKLAATIDQVLSEGTGAESHSLMPWVRSGIASLAKSQAATGSHDTGGVDAETVGEQWSSPIDDDLLATLATARRL